MDYKNVQDFINTNFLCVVVCMESFSLTRIEEYHGLWLKLAPYFLNAKIPICLLSQDSQEKLNQMKEEYPIALTYLHDENNAFFEENEVIKIKNVFGKEIRVVYTYFFLFKNQKPIMLQKRVNDKTIMKMFLKGFDIQHREFSEKVKKIFDI